VFIAILVVCGQIKAAVESLRNIRGLPWPRAAESRHKSGDADCLDWLQDMFGFQVGSASITYEVQSFWNI